MSKKRIISFLLAAMMLLSLCTACGPSGEGNTGGGDEDTLYLRLSTALQSTDWQQTAIMESSKITYIQLFEGLYGMDESAGGYYNLLAKDVQLSEDNLTYTIELVDATFQNGDPLTAEDVVFSYQLAMENPKFGYVTSMIDTVEAQGDKIVVVTLKFPYSAISHTFFTIKIYSKREYQEIVDSGVTFGTTPHTAGTGPYYVSEYDISAGVKLKAYENYWQGAPAIKNVEYRLITEDAAAVIAFENGELDYLIDAPLSEWEDIEAAAGERCTLQKANDIQFLAINYQSPSNNGILANPKVREAIFYAVNKDNVVKAATSGYGTAATEYMVPDYVATSPRVTDGKFETYDYSKEKCHQALLDAGFTEEEIAAGIPVGTIVTYNSDTAPKAKAAVVIQACLAENGMIAEVEIGENAPITDRLYKLDYDMCVYADSGNYDYNNIRQQVHSESVGMYVVCYKDDKNTFDWQKIESLVDQGVQTADVGERYDIYTELWSMVMDTATILPLYHNAVGIAWSDRVELASIDPFYYHLTDFSWAK
ncbi:MAG: ABC transporter substrate-binding protein [Oscillospiraceae bacterium]|jgi:peptide/nickel transport system substrate-binding protein|nr:ABC transporter substrate-binding protein [Oscillospiraceae bacterium]